MDAEDFNRDSVFVATSLYELPIGRGKHFMGNVSRGMDMLVGGWQWNATFTIGKRSSVLTQLCKLRSGPGHGTVPSQSARLLPHGFWRLQQPDHDRSVYFTPESTALCDSPYVNPSTL